MDLEFEMSAVYEVMADRFDGVVERWFHERFRSITWTGKEWKDAEDTD